MTFVDHSSIRRRWMAAIATGVFTALAVSSPGPAWGQDTGDPVGSGSTRGGGDGSRRDADDDDGRRR